MHRPFPSVPSSLTNTKHFMASQTLLSVLILHTFMIFLSSSPSSAHLFREYIGAEFTGVRFSDVPINPDVNFHFILAFALDYTTSSHPTPTNGHFNIFWDTGNLTPSHVAAIKRKHKNVKVALSLGGDSVGDDNAYFAPSSVDSWVENAVSSLTKIIKEYHLDGIDIDYEHFQAQPSTFAECIGRLITTLKKKGVISVASIAPFDNSQVQDHYIALWRKYDNVINYVNFQFYAYSKGTTISEFLGYFDAQMSNYKGRKILASFATDRSTGGLTPGNGFFGACRILQSQGKLHGIFIWSADDSKKNGFHHEKQAQLMLASGRRGLLAKGFYLL